MYKFFLPYLIIFPLIGFSQNFKIDWQTCYGGATNDKPYDMVTLEDGYLMTGIAKRNGADELILVKLDFNGNIIWEKEYGGTDGDAGIRLLPTTDGNFFLVGGTASSDGDIENDPYIDGLWDFWIIKIDPDGNFIWNKIYGGMGNDVIWDASLTSDGGLIAMGWVDSDDGDISIHYGWYDVWMIKLNSEGEKEWDFTMGTDEFDFAGGIIETSDNGFLVTSCSSVGSYGNINCDPYSQSTEIVIFKLDSVSNLEWQQCYGGSDTETPFDMIETEDGYLLASTTSSADGDVTGGGYHAGWNGFVNTSDTWILKLDFAGNIIWHKCYGGSGDEIPHRIFKTDDNNFLIFGNASSQDGDVIGNHSSGHPYNDIWIFKINGNGDLIWQQCFGGNGNETLEAGVIKVSDYQFIMASTIFGYNTGQITCQQTFNNNQAWIISVSDTTVGLKEKVLPNNIIKVYPNPASDYLIFESTHFKSLNIQIIDVYGKVIKVFEVKDKIILDTRNLQGFYFYKATDGFRMINGKFTVTR